MKAKELIENNSLTNIDIIGEQTVVFTEIALTAINMAREEGANNLIQQASANGQKKYQQGAEFMKQKAIESFKDNCLMWNSSCRNDCPQKDCEYLNRFIEKLNS